MSNVLSQKNILRKSTVSNKEWAARLKDFGQLLSNREREVVDYIIVYPHEAAFLKQNDLAQAAGVSKPLVISCYKKLGYTEFKGFQQGMQEFYASQINSYQASSAAFRDVDSIGSLIRHSIDVDSKALESVLESVDEKTLTRVADKIIVAGRVFILSEGTGFYPAHYLHQRLLRCGLTSILLSPDREHVLDGISGISAEDMFLTFYFNQHKSFVRELFRYTGERKGTIVLITGELDTDLVSAATHTIFIPRGQLNFKNSMAVPMWFANVLLLAVELRAGEPLQEHLRKLEIARKELE